MSSPVEPTPAAAVVVDRKLDAKPVSLGAAAAARPLAGGGSVVAPAAGPAQAPKFVLTPEADIERIVEAARARYNTGIARSHSWRKEQLRALFRMFDENEAVFLDASFQDMQKHHNETWAFDILILKNEIVDAIENLDKWSKPERVDPGLPNMLDTAEIRRDPFGLCLVIGAWNYPYQLTLGPMMAAIAAGNAVVIKPSEVATHAAAAMAHFLPQYLDPVLFPVIQGGVPETTALLKLRFDHIFYTGNGFVGKIVAAAAAKHLTPCVLELGGKSPVIIDETADLPTVAKRVMWAKSINCGQTCVAPDYVLVPRAKVDAFAAACKNAVIELYGADPRTNPHYPRVITKRQYDRLTDVLTKQTAASPSSKVAYGGETDASDLYIAPTVITGVKGSDPIMEDEIFGPLLPIVPVDSIHESIAFIRAREKPLALYVFSKNQKHIDTILAQTDSGNAVVNDLLMNMLIPNLPFGGVGASGSGKYHGKSGFDTYTHTRSYLQCPAGMDIVTMPRYPKMAYTATGRKVLSALLEKRVTGFWAVMRKLALPNRTWAYLLCIVLGFVVGGSAQSRWAWWR
ncbi:Aldehyde dehydrogenase, dimeric NADP-preferring [Geranomyces michiganensis]|nr:Aldehyde dehydrogenase, dimeric NADP-preferring [Geranomyces michiganensis]